MADTMAKIKEYLNSYYYLFVVPFFYYQLIARITIGHPPGISCHTGPSPWSRVGRVLTSHHLRHWPGGVIEHYLKMSDEKGDIYINYCQLPPPG